MGGGWNYRVMRHQDAGGVTYGIHEVYYTRGGKVDNWTERAVGIVADDLDALLGTLATMSEAINLNVLDGSTGEEIDEKRILSDRVKNVLQAAKDAGRIDFADDASEGGA